MRQRKRTRWSVLIFAIAMSIIMVGSLATGWLLQIAQQRDFRRQQQAQLEPTPVPTFEAPVTVDTITFEEDVLQANGIFSVSVPNPPEWGAIESSFDTFANRARLVMRNDLNVVEASAEQPSTPVTTIDELGELYNTQVLGATWRNYTNWRESARTVVTEDGREYLQIDFELEFGNRTYVARQRIWTENEQVYSVRVVTPENATELLVFLLDNISDSFTVRDEFAGVPISWDAYYDPELQHIIRFPTGWQITDAADGAPASIESQDVTLRVETIADESIDDEDAAEDYAAALPGVTEVFTVTETERGTLSGYTVSYQTRNLDGEIGSGMVLLLNDEDSLRVANLQVNGAEADLLDLPEAEETGEETQAAAIPLDLDQYAQVLNSFSTLSDLSYAAEASAASSAPLTDPAAAGQAPVNFGGF
jgi:hypothetical protein